ncbi:hypothetical protein D3C84_464370 [compost metagenome]
MIQIDLDAVVAALVSEKIEPVAQVRHQPLQRLRLRGSSAQMELLDTLPRPQVTPQQVDLAQQTLKMGFRPQACGKLHVQRQRTTLLATDAQCPQHIQRTDPAMKLAGVDMTIGVKHALVVANEGLAAGVE